MEFRGEPSDLERFALDVLKRPVAFERPSPLEYRMRWDAGGTEGFGSTTTLRSGLQLATARLAWDRPWAFQFRDQPTPLKFMLCRGQGPRMTLPDGSSHVLEGGALLVRRATTALSTTCEFTQGGSAFEQLALEVTPERLRELLGAPQLPQALEALMAGTAPQELYQQAVTPRLLRLTDELLYADARGPSRQLYLEAKGLELLAALIDELTLASDALSPLGAGDVARLERARRVLHERLACPPSLPELARSVGLNELKLKLGFRTLFDNSVFGYLRAERMEQARRLLAQRDVSVTEVALRVGYSNPSKFAAAFRKHFGFLPSAVR